MVSDADVVRAKMSVEMTQDLINEKRGKVTQIEGRIHEKVVPQKIDLILGKRKLVIHESSRQFSTRK